MKECVGAMEAGSNVSSGWIKTLILSFVAVSL